MRVLGFVACVAATAMAHAAAAAGANVADFEPDGLTELPLLDTAARPGFQLTPSLNLRLVTSLEHDARAAPNAFPVQAQLVDPSRRRRISSMLDYYPDGASGFHLTIGMHRAPKRARWTPGADSAIAIFMPRLNNPLMVKTNVARSSPMMMAGWSGLVARDVSFGVAAGAMQEHGKAMKVSAATIGRQQAIGGGWSRIGEVAQVNLSVAF